MISVVFLACIIASALNAGSSLFEREAASFSGSNKLFTKELSSILIRNKKFIFGIGMQVAASIVEVVAISQGSLVLVGPLLTLDLVFLWLFISRRYKLKISNLNWIAVGLIIGGLSLLYFCTDPKEGKFKYNWVPWVVASSIFVVLVFIAYVVSNITKSKTIHAMVLAVATAFNYALDAGLAKLLLDQIRAHGVFYMFTSWAIYALFILAMISIIMTQNTLHAGPLTVSQPVIEMVQAVSSALIGIFIFNDKLHSDWITIVGDGVAIIAIGVGIYITATTKDLFNS
jgi:hypothetical protein